MSSLVKLGSCLRWTPLLLLSLLCVSCGIVAPNGADLPASPTPDYAILEAQVERKLAATLTAKAPAPTRSPTPAPTNTPEPATPTQEATSTPPPTTAVTPTPAVPALAYARLSEDGTANVLLRDLDTGEEQMLTHFVEPRNVSDLSWSRDGQWLVVVSSHQHISSRNNERNVFMMRADGTDLQMLTGDYLSPEEAPGPYADLRGQVVEAPESCRVFAQGATGVVTTNEAGEFEIPGVPVSAEWVRAICQQENLLLEGDLSLSARNDAFEPVSLELAPSGQGWRQASLSPDNQIIAGTFYTWTLSLEEDAVDDAVLTQFKGVIYDPRTDVLKALAVPEGYTLNGVAWSPQGDRLVGTCAGEEGVQLRFWDATGVPMDAVIEISTPEDQLLTAAHPDWSPDGSLIVFELRRHLWWGDPQYRIDLVVADVASASVNTLIESDWGVDATHPGWSADGALIAYQLSSGKPGEDHSSRTTADVWQVSLAAPTPAPLTTDGVSYLPSLRP